MNEHELSDLKTINTEMVRHENEGSTEDARAYFFDLLTDMFVFRRASGVVVDRQAFLKALTSGGDRALIGEIEVTPLGEERALVRSTVQTYVGGDRRTFDNARLFVRIEGRWRLLAWANESTKH